LILQPFDNNMSISLNVPKKIWPLQTSFISAQQNSGVGIDVSGLLSTILPILTIAMMMRMVTNMGTPNRIKTSTAESNPPQTERTATAITG
jgi:hypothetical protein